MRGFFCLVRELIEGNKEPYNGYIEGINLDEVAYVYWSCVYDDNCSICRQNYEKYSKGKPWALNRDKYWTAETYWIPGLVTIPKPPLSSAIMVYVMLEESGAKETAEFIRRSGGLVTKEELDRYSDDQLIPIRTKREKEYLASKKSLTAMELEKSNPDKAISLYRESISLNFEAISILSEQFDDRNFPYRFNRLTLLLEKSGKFTEALEEIKRFETLPCCVTSPKSEIESLNKRKIRLQKKCNKSNEITTGKS